MREIKYDAGPTPDHSMGVHEYQEAFIRHEVAQVVADLNKAIQDEGDREALATAWAQGYNTAMIDAQHMRHSPNPYREDYTEGEE